MNVANGLPIDWPKFRLTNGILAKPWGPWDGFTRGFQLKESIIYPPDIHNVCFYDKASTVAMDSSDSCLILLSVLTVGYGHPFLLERADIIVSFTEMKLRKKIMVPNITLHLCFAR